MKSTMKKINFKAILFLPLIILMLFTACQNEEEEIINPTNEETIIPNSNLASLMLNTVTRDGSYDNIIDFANCLSIELPVTIIVNDITITINSVEDLELIEAILEQFDNDNDEIEIQFPIIIISSDYSEIVINNQEELEALIEECSGENEEDDDIECIDFQYPISIAIYNSDFQVIDTIVINSDEELYMFIETLEGGVLASLNFPITMVLANGETIIVNNNEELEIAISEAIYDCDEDDDNDYDDDDEYDCPDLQANIGDICETTGANELGIINTNCECQENTTTLECANLQECYWYVDTNLYNTFVAEQFYFGANNVVEIINEETNQLEDIGNYWVNVQPNGSQTLTFIFNQEPHDLISLEWEVVVCDEGIIELVHENDILVLSQECDTTFDCPDIQGNIGDVCENPNGVLGIINVNCECEINDNTFDCPDLQANVGDDCETGSGVLGVINADCECEVNDNTFDCPDLQANVGDDCLNPLGVLGVVNENCECEVDDTNFDCPDLQANVGDDCVTSTGDAGFVNADCACELRDTCTEQDIDAYLLECVWYIVNYNGDDNLITFEFDFNEDGTVIITGENLVITAMWSTSEGGAGVILEFGNVNGGDIQAITGNWLVVECNSGRLEMFRDNDFMVMEQDCN